MWILAVIHHSPCTNACKSQKNTFTTRRRSESAYICQVHDNVMMYTSTRLHKHLPMYLRNDNDVIDNDGCGVTGVFLCGKIHLKWCWHFCTFLHNPHLDVEPDYVIRKPRKGRFQRYIVRTKIFWTFHAWVEYISVKTVIRQIDLPMRTDGQKTSQYIPRSLRSLGGYKNILTVL